MQRLFLRHSFLRDTFSEGSFWMSMQDQSCRLSSFSSRTPLQPFSQDILLFYSLMLVFRFNLHSTSSCGLCVFPKVIYSLTVRLRIDIYEVSNNRKNGTSTS